jgi:ferrous iron transport protein B
VLVNELEQYLGVPVVPISAAKDEGISELVDHALHVAKYQERPMQQDFCRTEDHNGAVHRAIHAVMHLIEDHAAKADIPIRFAATKLIEGDPHILKELRLDENEEELLEHIVLQMEKERGLDRSAAIADMRFDYINKAVEETVIKPRESKEHERSAKIDRILTGRYTAIPSFVAIMAVVFWLTFDLIGGNLQALVELGIEKITELTEAALTAANVNEVVCSLVIDGIYNGVGTVLTALPFILTLFFCLSILEDSGYMARIAFVMDKSMRKIGLSGRSIVPMLMGFGCSVPAIMSSRTLPSERDRKMTIMLVPFMSCTAKIPIYTFFAAAFFPNHTALVMIVLYFTGILVSIVTAMIAKKTAFKGEAVPFVMELPNYRMPGAKSVLQLLWEKTKDFLKRAFTIIFIATIVVWFLQSFNTRLHLVTDIDDSILAMIAGWLAPIFAPLGFGDWRISTALITGFMAKESVVSTLSVLFGSIASLQAVLSTRTATSLLVFCLLYTPCIAAIASVKRELGARSAAFMVVFQCAVAWICAFLVYLLGGII